MNDLISLEIITGTETVVKEEIRELFLPAYYGEAGILSNHLPFISVLKFGELSYKDADGRSRFLYIENGFLETRDNGVIIISDLAVKGENLDRGKIESELAEVNSRIKSASEGGITPEELSAALTEQKKLVAKSGILKKIN